MTTTPRPFQRAALGATTGAGREGKRSGLVVMPTGTGETVVFAQAATQAAEAFRPDGRTLVLAQELIDQAVEKVRAWKPGRWC